MLSYMSQIEKDTYCTMLYICGIEKNTANCYIKEKRIKLTNKENKLVFTSGKEAEGQHREWKEKGYYGII